MGRILKKYRISTLLWSAVLFFIMGGCYFLAVLCLGRVQKTSGIITVMLEGSPLSGKEAQEILTREEEQEDFVQSCFWGELPGVELVCRETAKISRTLAIVTKGNPELVMSGTVSLQWQEDGCFLDTQTAEELFGTQQAAGQRLWCEEKSYTVCGTFDSLRRVMVRQAEPQDGACLDTISLHTPKEETLEAVWSIQVAKSSAGSAEQFLMRNALTGEVAEFTLPGVVAGDLLLILPLFLAATIFYFFLKSGKKASARGEKWFCFVAAFAVMAAALWLILQYWRIPQDMIPSKWSDFTFWSDWWNRQRQNLLRILGSAQGEMQLMLLWNLLVSFVANLIALFSGMAFVKKLKEINI
ncbi:hypothetical protein D7Y05_02445 [bacterium 1XD42-54]|jgi:hypothetical protein|nr:hypothetical protein D7Y05_02445 [bacterium 1XD42-54]